MKQQNRNQLPETNSRRVVIHADGSCIGNPGPGGWAAILSSSDGDRLLGRKTISGGDSHSTNVRMEMTAAIEGLKAVNLGHRPVIVVTDNKMIVDGMKEWLPDWKRRGWKTSSGIPVKNQDLWVQLDNLAAKHNAEFKWVRGHNGEPLNEEADRLANEAARKAAWPPLAA